MVDHKHFYQDLPVLESFSEVTNANLHTAVPHEWWIAIADVVNSTKAIEAGDYKKVNTVGVACIAAVMNVDRHLELPFIFGGDGATFVIPDELREPVVKALRAAQKMARESFGLELRVGLVQIAALIKQDFEACIGKVRISQFILQPVLSGSGWEEAERRVKTAMENDVLRITENEGVAEGSFEGFECRWKNVPNFHGHKLSLLVAATTHHPQTDLAMYRRLFAEIESIYGDVSQYHPLRASHLTMSFNPRQLSHEWRVRTVKNSLFKKAYYFTQLFWQNLVGSVLFMKNSKTSQIDWHHYRAELVENSDFRKFDGMLRMVIDGNDQQAEQLQAWLEKEYRNHTLSYGIHKSQDALLTCIVQSYNGNHQHFVDGSDGGYAMAARELKRRLFDTAK